ncbi:CHAT domain-containing protein [Synechocystis sp. PCC 7509]|uniref:CHAT domain-containing protein n=1 Tax=Synechocystis sp. PCC 7509 TaxID=927677 RepID=UPI0002ACBBFF|nr:CHAT domain-containing protein [Synechocystis sp. PCC 7509]
MARKWFIFFGELQPILTNSRPKKDLAKKLLQASLAVGIICLIPEQLIAASLPSVSPLQATEDSQLVQTGRKLYETGQFLAAIKVWQLSLQAYQKQNDVANQAMVLSNLSLAYQQLGQWEEATKAIASSLKLLPPSTAKNLPILAQALNTQGSLQLSLGQSQEALNTWVQATATYTQAKDETGIARSLINQSLALQALGFYRRALATLNSVNQNLQKQPDSLVKIAGLRNLGNGLRVVGDLEQSQQILQQSLTLAQKLNSTPDVGSALFSLGNTARAQKDNKAALKYYKQATNTSSGILKTQAQLNQLSLLIETNQTVAAKSLLPQIKTEIASLPLSSKAIYAQIDFAQSLQELPTPDLAEIAQLLAISVQQAQSFGDKRAQAYALSNLGQLYVQTQQWENAQKLTEQSLVIAQSINAPDIAYRSSWQLGQIFKAQGKLTKAIAAYTESVSLLKSLRNDLVAINPEVQFSFREEVEPVYRELVDLLLSKDNPTVTQENLIQARAVIESLQVAQLDNFFREACIEGNSILIDSLADKEDQSAAIIYPIILGDRTEVILKLPNAPLTHYTITKSQPQVEKTLETLRLKLTEPDTIKEVKALSQEVYSWLIQPAEAQIAKSGAKTLVFVLDGALQNIPMATLYDGKQYLVEKYAVTLSPGLQLLAPQPLPQNGLKALTAGLSIAPANSPYPALPAVKAEFNLIKQAGVATNQLLDENFTRKSLARAIDSTDFNIVHLATHGQFSSQAKDTFILAADGEINVKQLDNLLRNANGGKSRNPNSPEAISLLVLSACETAVGDKRAALGLAGVAIRAGARSTLASLWQIDDEATALFIGEFYRELANNKITKAEALRRAQVSFLKNYPNYSRPSYWGAYVLIGNWL